MIWVVVGALGIGITLGLLGSGGSILTVPILVYLVGQDEKAAIAGSLLVVGSIAAVGGLQYVARGLVHWRSVFWFGLPGMAGTWMGARLSALVSGAVQLAVFDLVMLVAAVLMLRPPKADPAAAVAPRAEQARWKVVVDGLVVGLLTGFVGVGGGFLIVPALVLLGGLPMNRAIGTSLLIIALKSFSGFVKYLDVLRDLGIHLDWGVLGAFVGIGVLGTAVGSQLGRKLPHATLQRGFAVLLLLAGLAILVAVGSDLIGGAGAASTSG